MSFAIKKKTAIAVTEEATEGIYEEPSVGSDFVQVLADGFELNPAKEVISRDILTASVGMVSPRTGQFQSSGTIPTEFRAAETEGGAPETDLLVKSALGTKRSITSEVTSKTGNTDSRLELEDIDVTKYTVGDIIMIKEAGAFHVSPIKVVDETPSFAFIDLEITAVAGAFSDNVIIAKSTIYAVADELHAPLSITKWIENKQRELAVGAKISTLSIENFLTGQIPNINFGFEGLNFDRQLNVLSITPDYDDSLPPILLEGGVFQDDTKIQINELSVNLENSLGFVTSICAPNGRISSRVTNRTVTGTFNPYKDPDSIDNFTKYKENTPFKLFAFGKVPSGVDGEFSQVVAVFMPNCLMTELGEADQDGILQDAITFSADRGVSGDIPEIFIAFI